LGTNVGGAISAVVGFGFAWITFAQKRIRWHTVVTVALATILVLGVLMLIDSANSHGEQSHIGQTVELVRRDGPAALVLIIIRKLSMNLKLLR
jgi:high-affinity Fe2+/Pb2+ permease